MMAFRGRGRTFVVLLASGTLARGLQLPCRLGRMPVPAAAHVVCFASGGIDAGADAELKEAQRLSLLRETADKLAQEVGSALAKEERKQKSLTKEAGGAARAEEIARQAELIISNLYRIDESAREIVVQDWSEVSQDGTPAERVIVIDGGYTSAREWAEAAFKKARRMRRGSAEIQRLLDKSSARRSALSSLVHDLNTVREAASISEVQLDEMAALAATLGVRLPTATSSEEATMRSRTASGQKVGRAGKPPTIRSKEWTGRRFLSPNGVPILVGKSKRENEQLSLFIAKPPDVWMHARDAPGAHVVLQLSRSRQRTAPDAQPADECLQMAANLAVFFSALRHENRALVTTASPKHLIKPRGAAIGQLGIREELGSIVGIPADVPQECIDARAQNPDSFGTGPSQSPKRTRRTG